VVDEFDRLERKWLTGLLNPSREPDSDPVFEMLGGVQHLRYNWWEASGGAVARIDLSPSASRVILRSPIIHPTAADTLAREPFGSYSIQLMGIPVRVDDQLPDGIVVFLGSSGDVVRLIWLTDDIPPSTESSG